MARPGHVAAILALVGLILAGAPAMAQPVPSGQNVTTEEWSAYQQRFVAPEGRIIDDANGNISHSEGQGYGLLLAYLAGDRPAFERIWSFTKTELLLRDDGLAVWKWDPAARPHVTDVNNASDGDLLIAYALGLAAAAWEDADYLAAGRRIAEALGKTSIHRHNGELQLRPAVAGFGAKDRADGPVVNPSYWIFEAFPMMAELAPDYDWAGLGASGIRIISRAMTEEHPLPPEWLSLRRAPVPAEGFDPFFSYNALRIPLYLSRADDDGLELLRRMAGVIGDAGNGFPLMNVDTGVVIQRLMDPGYRIIAALARCRADGTPVPGDLQVFQPTNYFPSTLHLLALAYMRGEGVRCAG